MSDLKQIETRHGGDRLRDAIFIAGAVILTALSIGSVTSHGSRGHVTEKVGSVQMVENPDLLRQ